MSRRRPKPPDLGPRKKYNFPKKADFPAYAVVFDDRIIYRTPYNAEFIDDIKQIPAKLRAFVKDGRPLENSLRQHLETHEDYFSSRDELASVVEALVNSIAASNGLSDSWVVSLAAPELFEFSMAAALKQFPEIALFDVRILEEGDQG